MCNTCAPLETYLPAVDETAATESMLDMRVLRGLARFDTRVTNLIRENGPEALDIGKVLHINTCYALYLGPLVNKVHHIDVITDDSPMQ